METDDNDLAKGDSKRLEQFLTIENNYTAYNYPFSMNSNINKLFETSPKVKALIDNIKRLDRIDAETKGGVFKHFIYSRLKGRNRGITLVEAVFNLLKNEGYEVYQSKEDTKTIVRKFNSRYNNEQEKMKSNVRGEEIRFLGLSEPHKEGLDLFDVKYCHIFEMPSNMTDMKQIIGRGTRQCGQKGLKDQFPWNLNVFIYRLSIPQSMRNYYTVKGETFHLDYDYFSDYYLTYKVGYDDYINRIEDYAHYMSVDFGLTQEYIPLQSIGNTQLVPIKLEGLPNEVITKPFKKYRDKDDIIKEEEEDKNLRDMLSTQQLDFDIRNQLLDKNVSAVASIPETDDEIVRKALEILRKRKKVTAVKDLPSKSGGIIDKVIAFFKSVGSVKGKDDKTNIYKMIDESGCDVKIGKARGSGKNTMLLSYPVIQGDKIYNFCFSKDEIMDLISTNNGMFSDSIMKELKEELGKKGISNVIIDQKMSSDFKSAVLDSTNPVFTKSNVEKSIMTIVLDMMINYLEYSNVDVNAGLFYRFLNYGKNALFALIKAPLKLLRFILLHPTLSVVFMILVKLVKIAFCIYTSNVENFYIDTVVEQLKSYIGESGPAKAFMEILKVTCKCVKASFASLLTGNIVGMFTSCLAEINLGSFSLSGTATWVMTTVIDVMKTALSKFSFDVRGFQFVRNLVEKPFETVATMMFGVDIKYGTVKSDDSVAIDENNPLHRFRSYFETLAYYMRGDFDMLVVVIILQLLPYSFMKWILGRLVGIMAEVPGLKGISNMLVEFNRYVESWTSGSCLDMVIWAMNTYPHYEIVVYLMNQMKVLFTEVVPCLYGKLISYVKSWYTGTVNTNFENCCNSDIKEALEFVIARYAVTKDGEALTQNSKKRKNTLAQSSKTRKNALAQNSKTRKNTLAQSSKTLKNAFFKSKTRRNRLSFSNLVFS